MNSTVVSEAVIKMIKEKAEQGYTRLTDMYEAGAEDGAVAFAQSVLMLLNIPFTISREFKDKQ